MKLSFKIFNLEIGFSFNKQPKPFSKKCVCMINKTQEVFDKRLELVSKEWDELSVGDKKLVIGLPVSAEELGLK